EPPPAEPPVTEPEPPVVEPEPPVKEPEPPPEEPEPPVKEPEAPPEEPEPPVTEPGPALTMAAAASAKDAPAAEPESPVVLEAAMVEGAVAPMVAPERAPSTESAHWLLSLFSPAPADMVDWGRGKYTVLTRGGRVDSPAGSGELK